MAIIGVTKKEKDEKILNSKQEIDINIDMRMPKLPSINKNDKRYKCFCCGNSWDVPKTHFTKSFSPLFQANDGCIPICNECRDLYYSKLVDLYSGNEAHAIKHFCQMFDIIFEDNAFSASRQISADRNRLGNYLAKRNLAQTTKVGYTYADGMKYDFVEKQKAVITSVEQAKSEESTITASAIDRWGIGFQEIDYKNMDEHYRMLKRNNPNADNNQEIFIKTLCNLYMLEVRALQKGDSKEYTSLADQYAKTFKQAGLKTVEEKDSSNDEVIGVTLATISQFTPEEFYKDKQLYSDWDLIGEYYERHVCRPMQNIMTGSDIRDKEFFVPESEDDYED